MASNFDPDEDPPQMQIPDTKILPYIQKEFEQLRNEKADRVIPSIFELYRDYERGQTSFLIEDLSSRITDIVERYLMKYNDHIQDVPDMLADEMDAGYDRYKLIRCILDEATTKGRMILIFNVFLAIALPTVYSDDGLEALDEILAAVEQYLRRVGESLHVVWESFDKLADTLAVQLIFPAYRTTGTYTPGPNSAWEDGDGNLLPGMTEQTAESFENFVLMTLERDKYKCVVTKQFDTLAEVGTITSAHKVAHIIPWGLDWSISRSRAVRNKLGWIHLNIFDASSTRLSDSLSMKLDQPKNGLTLDRDVYRHFESMHLWLQYDKETQEEYIYTVDGDANKLAGIDLPSDRKVIIEKGPQCPERRFLDIHAKLSRIANISGALNMARQFTGANATRFDEYSDKKKGVHAKALELKLLSIDGADED